MRHCLSSRREAWFMALNPCSHSAEFLASLANIALKCFVSIFFTLWLMYSPIFLCVHHFLGQAWSFAHRYLMLTPANTYRFFLRLGTVNPDACIIFPCSTSFPDKLKLWRLFWGIWRALSTTRKVLNKLLKAQEASTKVVL